MTAATLEAANQKLRGAVEARLATGSYDEYIEVADGPATTVTCCEGQRLRGDSLLGIPTAAEVVEQFNPTHPITEKFGTGAVRSASVEDFRYDLISPIGLREVARTCAEGAAKYSDFNWEKGMPVHDLLNHAIAHVYAFLSGDRSEPHLGHAAWNLLAAIHSHELWPHLNDGHLREDGCRCPSSAT